MSLGLTIANLDVAFDARRVIKNLVLPTIEPGTVTAIVGPNGSGKSTFLRAIAGLAPAKGEVHFNEHHLHKMNLRERSQQVVYQPQNPPSAVHLRVFESVLTARKASPLSALASIEQPMQACSSLLSALGVQHLAMSYLDELSGGQRQLAGLAQALIRQPRVLLLDEPISALDLNYQHHVMTLVREETKRLGMVTLVVLHDLALALRHADRIVALREGLVLADGPPFKAITSDRLAEIYKVRARVERCSLGTPVVVVDGLAL